MPFQKGQSGNPSGAPKRTWTWSGVLQKAVEEHDEDGIPIKEVVAQSLIKEARKGNVLAQKEIMNRMDGMPRQDTDITSGGEAIKIIFGTEKFDGTDNTVTDEQLS